MNGYIYMIRNKINGMVLCDVHMWVLEFYSLAHARMYMQQHALPDSAFRAVVRRAATLEDEKRRTGKEVQSNEADD